MKGENNPHGALPLFIGEGDHEVVMGCKRFFLKNTNLTNDTNNSLEVNRNLICPQWQPISDRIVNTLWSQMSSVMRVNIQDIYRVIESDYVPAFNPFVEYLESLPEWHEGDHDYIADLAATVKIKGEQEHMESPEADSSLFTLPSSLPSLFVFPLRSGSSPW